MFISSIAAVHPNAVLQSFTQGEQGVETTGHPKLLLLVTALAGEHSAAPRATGSGAGTNETGVLCGHSGRGRLALKPHLNITGKYCL